MMREIAGTTSFVEPEETRRIYARIPCGGADTCNCLPCRNFQLVRDAAYPPDFRELLNELGIDYRKELEVFLGVPLENGTHLYEGWFCFVGKAYGRAMSTSDSSTDTGFSYRIADSAPGPQREFEDHGVLHLEFRTSVPWLLPEPWSLDELPRRPIL
jgi:hypothetical protein